MLACPARAARAARAARPLLLLVLAAACTTRDAKPEAQQAGAPATPPAKLSGAMDQFFVVGDARLRFRDAGVGTPIVFIHGYTQSLEHWLAYTDSFPGHRVIAYDVRGFGQSMKSGDATRFGAAMATDVIALLDHLKIDRAHLVGHSMGAQIAAYVATHYPQRVLSASLVAGPFYPDSTSQSQAVASYVGDLQRGDGVTKLARWLFPGMPDSVARGLNEQIMSANDSASLIATLSSVGALTTSQKQAAAATTPVLIAAAERDPLTPTSRWLAKHWPKARFISPPGTDHMSVVMHPQVITGIRGMLGVAATAARPR